ncbi:MAG: tetratricopeptide repeat protein, partial [Anaerolineales bacterium]|nr:tetratricopeptide repeat protein [Anaerolineales bacterium]
TMRMNRAINSQKEARLNEAVVDLEQAREIFERIGDADQAGSVWVNLGMIYTIWGDDDEAVACLQKAVALATQHNIPNLEAYAKTTLARPLLRQGELAAAVTLVAEALALCRQYRYPDLTAVSLLWQGWLHHEQGETEKGLTLLQQAVRLAEPNHFLQEAGIALSFQGQLLDAQQMVAEAKAAHQKALELLAEQDRYELALAQLALAQHSLAQTTALSPEIAELLATARAGFVALGAVGETAVVDTLLRHE